MPTTCCMPLTRLLHASYTLLTRLLGARPSMPTTCCTCCMPLTRLLHASYKPLTRLFTSCGSSQEQVYEQVEAQRDWRASMLRCYRSSLLHAFLHASYTPLTRLLHASTACFAATGLASYTPLTRLHMPLTRLLLARLLHAGCMLRCYMLQRRSACSCTAPASVAYTPTLTRLRLHAFSYTPPLTRLLLHAYSYTPPLTRLLFGATATERMWMPGLVAHLYYASVACSRSLNTALRPHTLVAEGLIH
jgi:hypothetical protein